MKKYHLKLIFFFLFVSLWKKGMHNQIPLKINTIK